MIKNDVRNISSQCQVIFFNWQNAVVNDNLTDAQVSATTILDVSRYVQDMSFSKTLGDPAGTFQLRLPNDRDWKQILHPGTWGVVYMTQNTNLAISTTPWNPSPTNHNVDQVNLASLLNQQDKIRGIIFIDRVAVTGRTGEERGEYDAEFLVSGRDFGVVYVENEIYYNRLLYEGKIQDAAASALTAASVKTTDTLLTVLHRLFFSPDKLPGVSLIGGANLQKDIPRQWLLPPLLLTVLGIQTPNSNSYFGDIPEETLLNFDSTYCSYPVDNPMTKIEGKAWDRLKTFSIEPFHELFTETNDVGQPQLNFRYIPWKTSDGDALGKLNDFVQNMVDLPAVPVDQIDILDFDLGEESHNRYNYFFSSIDGSLFNANTTMQVLADISPQTGFPRVQENSIKRYGLRLMLSTVNALYILGLDQADPDLLRLHNELMLEYWNNAVFFESGTITIVGNNDVKIGKILTVAPLAPFNGGKVFYIEGYTDHFSSDEKGAGFWTQTLTVTRGFYPGQIGARGEPYTENGEFTPRG